MKLSTFIQAFVLTGSFVLLTAAASLAEEDCCAGNAACDAMHKAKSKANARSKKEVEEVSTEKSTEKKVEEKPVNPSTAEPSKASSY